MSGTKHHTWQLDCGGHLVTTVQLDAIADGPDVKHASLATVAVQLIDLMDKHHLPATWAVCDPAHSAATSRIMRSSVPHEIAVLGDANWIGVNAGRTRFAHELSRRVAQARSAGLSVHSLVPRMASIGKNVDLVVKQQITAIAGVGVSTSPAPPFSSPRNMHFGVWEIPITRRLPACSGWFSSRGWSTWRRIRGAAKDAALFHLLIDAPSICEGGQSAQKTIAWLMDRVATLRDRGLIHAETLWETAARLSNVPTITPQQSILRRAA